MARQTWPETMAVTVYQPYSFDPKQFSGLQPKTFTPSHKRLSFLAYLCVPVLPLLWSSEEVSSLFFVRLFCLSHEQKVEWAVARARKLGTTIYVLFMVLVTS